MSQENAELLRRAVDAYNRRDVDAVIAELDPEVVWYPALPGLLAEDGAGYRGHDGIRAMFHDFYEVLDEIRFEISEIHDLGDRVVGVGQVHTRGKASGAATDSPYANVAEVRDGKGVSIRGYLDPDEALRDAGVGG